MPSLLSKLAVVFALSLVVVGAPSQIRINAAENSHLELVMGSYTPPADYGETRMTCSVETSLTVDHTGRGTWYEPGLGNCGWTNNRNEKVVAISKTLYDRNHGSNCGQWIEIVDKKNGRRSRGKTVDSCPGCGENDLDLSPALFKDFEGLDVGVLSITWHFVKK